MALKTLRFDPVRHLETEEDIFYYLEAAMEGNDPKHIESDPNTLLPIKFRIFE